MNDNPVRRLNAFGQSPWLDFISRDLVRSGDPDRLIERWGLGGVTSNPAIFEKAIAHSGDYDADISRVSSTGASTATMVDGHLERIIAEDGSSAALARELRGEIAIASAKHAYAIAQEVAASQRFQALARSGGRMQRLLWASTGTKNPAYDDIKYVQPLIGPQTVSTMPIETLEAYEQHGVPAASLAENLAAAQESLNKLEDLGIDLEHLTDRLLGEGIDKFIHPFDATYRAIEEKRHTASAAGPAP